MPLTEGFYAATILSTRWVRGHKGVGLAVTVSVHGPEQPSVEYEMSATIWFTPRCITPHPKHGESLAEMQLRAVGFTGQLAEARRIGAEVNLTGHPTRVHLRYKEYHGRRFLQLSLFVTAADEGVRREAPPATDDEVAEFFDTLSPPTATP